ncbi:MAG TPA: hypothetical protein PLD47_07770 [Aggregatilineales bacterium]|nr:hypothetical protein [Aggregatilineales bacterium]
MQTLARTLAEYDLELLRVIANRWDVDLATHQPAAAAEHLAIVMLTPEKARGMWAKLPDDQRMALQTLIGSKGAMPFPMFSKMFGEIKSVGIDKLVREKPYMNPASPAEALYYRGMVAKRMQKSTQGQPIPVVYVPSDLATLAGEFLQATSSYAQLAQEPLPTVLPKMPPNAKLADTTIVDDLTTFLALCRIEDIPLKEGVLPAEYRTGIKKYFLGTGSTAHLALMIALALDLHLVESPEQNNGLLQLHSAEAKKWLELPRSAQLHALVKAWYGSIRYNELWLLPGIKPEKTGWQNDPTLPRKTMLSALDIVSPGAWCPVEEIIEGIKEDEPAFQRPNADFDSWYIRDAETGKYLRGMDSWDVIDGAVLKFVLTGVMHGLGLVDITADASAFRLTGYGTAFIDDEEAKETPFPSDTQIAKPILIKPDLTIEVPRAASRFQRFQIARFTEWVSAGDPYLFKLSPTGWERAKGQNLKAEPVITFLRHASGEKLSDEIIAMIEGWDMSGSTSVPCRMSQPIILETPTADLLTRILNNPGLRRYVGRQLGAATVVVREEHWSSLMDALKEEGIMVVLEGGEDES